MPIAKCPRCDGTYNKSAQQNTAVCPSCVPAEEADFDLIRDTLGDNPDLNAEQLSEVCGVAIDCVMRMLDTGGIANINFDHSVKCGRCGNLAISATKRLCQSCLDKLDKEVSKSRNNIQLKKKKDAQVGEYSVNVRKMLDAKRK